MTYFEPAQAELLSSDVQHSSVYFGFWDVLHEMGFQNISPVHLYRQLASDVRQALEEGLQFDSELRDSIPGEVSYKISQSMVNFRSVYTKESFAIFLLKRGQQNHYLFVGENKREVHSLIGKINEKLGVLRTSRENRAQVGLSEKDGKEAYNFKIKTGEPLADELTRNLSPEINSIGGADNALEREVKSHLKDYLSTCISTGADLNIKLEHNENKEFDLLLHLTPTSRIYIEVKDAIKTQGVKEDIDWKNKLIQRPWEYTTLLQEFTKLENSDSYLSNLQTTLCFVVVRGFQEDITVYQNIADNRGIEIIEYDERGEYIEKIEEKAKEILIEQTWLQSVDGKFGEMDVASYTNHKL